MKKIKIMLIFFAFFVLFGAIYGKSEINIDILDNRSYIDYTLPFNSGFSLELPDFDSLIYSKILPSDINYSINGSLLTVNSTIPGTIILKYKGTPFLDNKSFYDKTLDFHILQKTEINITSDENISKINTLEINDNSYSTETNEDITLHILINKDPFRLGNIVLIIVCFVIIIFIALPIILSKLKSKTKKEKLYLDNNQEKIYTLIQKHKGITQQQIANTLNIKKSHMSKILNKMERNNIIERKKVGKVNKIVLAEKK
jgi:uncharacterized membrane protein